MRRQPFFELIAARSRWLAIGMGIKRWLLLLGFGSAVAGIGLVYLILLLERAGLLPQLLYNILTVQFLPPWLRVLVLLSAGGLIIILAVVRLARNLVAPFRRPDEAVSESIYHYQRRRRGPHIVAIGGGTGMPGLLRGLTAYTDNITAIVTVADDGGSSGRLRRELGLLPPGDFRNNMAALARDEALMTQLLQYRFGGRTPVNGRPELQGHAFGNLLLAALAGITGSFEGALLAAERVLALRGRVLPSTIDQVTLVADVLVPAADGSESMTLRRIVGESAIPKAEGKIKQVYLEPHGVRAHPPALQAIFQADLIVLGPGSLYTSILPNLLVPGLAGALTHARAPKVYVCNLAAQPGETDNYDVADHVAAIVQHVSPSCIDLVLANNNFSIPPDRGGGRTKFVQLAEPPVGWLIAADLVDEKRPWRHDSAKLAGAMMELLAR